MQCPPTPGPGQNGMKPNGLVEAAPDRLPQVDVEIARQEGELVDERDVHVPEGVLDQLGHLGLARRRHELDLVDERPVEPRGEIAVALGQTPDDLRGLGDVVELAAGVDAFGRVGEREVASRTQTRRLQDRAQDLFGRSRVGGRFEDDERSRLQGLRDGASGALDEPEVGAVIGERCRDADQDDVAAAERRSTRGDPEPERMSARTSSGTSEMYDRPCASASTRV